MHFLTRWPFWYQLLIGYTAAMGIFAMREHGRRARALQAPPATVDPGLFLAGQRAGQWTRVLSWFVGVALLLTGAQWALALVAVGYAVSARRVFREFAMGFAAGRKSVELASAPEYVLGRVPPDTVALVVAGVFVAVTRLMPLGATIVAIIRLPR